MRAGSAPATMDLCSGCASRRREMSVVVTYELHVVGRLGPATLASFPGLTATTAPLNTVLTGQFDSDEQLRALVDELGALGLELTELRQLPGGTEPTYQPLTPEPTAAPTEEEAR